MRDNPYKDLPPLERRPDGSLYRMDVVHRGNPNPNRLSDLHGVSARGDGSPLSRLSVADQTAPKARHQKRGNPVRISPFLVRVAIQNFLKNPVISTVLGFRTTSFLA